MQFDKEVDLKIIQALKSFVSRELRGLEAWKELHEQLTAIVREIRRISPKLLKVYVMKKLIFNIKRNRYKLPPEDVEMLCYPFLATLVNLKLIIFDNEKYSEIAPEKLERQQIVIKYLLSRSRFNRELWQQLHKLAEEHPREYHYINVNNPQYGLTMKEKTYLRRFARKITSEKSNGKAIEKSADPNKWLSKRRSQKKGNLIGGVILNELLPSVKKLSGNPLLNSPVEESVAPLVDTNEESEINKMDTSMNEATQIITGLALAEDLVIMRDEEETASAAEQYENEEMDVIQVSSESETEELIPYDFYEDSTDTSDLDEDVIYIT